MKGLVKALLLLASVSSATLTATELQLEGQLTQGALLRGKAPPGARVFFNDIELPLSADGQFVFGLGRDAALEHTLTLEFAGKKQRQTLNISGREYDVQRVNGVAPKYVSPPAEVTERIRRDNVKVRKVREKVSSLPFIFTTPVMPAQGRISGAYGSQRIFNGEPRNPHYGLDVAAPVGAPVVAPLSGTVVLAEDLYYSGLTMIIDHGFGISSTFMHLSKFTANTGDSVSQGDKIAEVGATGRVTGPHLDWRINWQQERLDPALLPGLKLTP
jgi:murein DD-endopeptidase MepM/ murein hydrolase activator NlpD